MNQKINFICFSLLAGLLLNPAKTKAQDNLVLINYVDTLLDLEYLKAIGVSDNFQSETLKKEAISLTTILYKAGQEKHQPNPALNDIPNESKVLNLLQLGYYQLYYNPNEPGALKYFFKAHNLSKLENNEALIKISLLAILEFYHFEYAQTHTHYNKYLDQLENIAESPIDKCWVHIYKLYFYYQSIVDYNENEINQTFILLEKELEKLPKEHNFFILYNSIKAVQLENSGNLDTALEKHNLVIKLAENKAFFNYLIFRSYIRISEIYHEKKSHNKGLKTLAIARNFIDKSNTLKSNIYINKYSAKHYYALGNHQKAFELLNTSVNKQYELDYKENSIQNSSLEIELQTFEKEKKLLIAKEKQDRNRYIAISLSGVLILGFVIALLLQKNTKRKQRIAEQEREIEIQKTEKVLKEQELNTIDAMIAGQEKERKKLAEDLHDSVGATLAAAKLQFNHLSQHRDKLDTMDELFTKTSSLLDDAYSEIRSMAHLKNSGVIAKNGLLPALEKLAKNASSTNGLQVTVENFGLEKRLDSAHEITIFRIIQELVTNIIKHAEATEANISLTPHEEELSIIIEDNGKGFNPRSVIDKEGMGLANIERRVEHIEGTIEVDSTPGKGTTILIDIPL